VPEGETILESLPPVLVSVSLARHLVGVTFVNNIEEDFNSS
jgi:hypothetical protein